MRLLFDQNLSPRLPRLLADLFSASLHVREVGLRAAPDPLIRQYAAAHGLVIVSKDSDFAEFALSHGAPPKVVWLRLGNCSTAQVESLLRHHVSDLLAFEHDSSPVLILL